MLTQLRIQNFKSWRDTGQMRFAPLTGFFGPNSSGKTSILQFLLMLKQTVESIDRAQVLNLGDERTYVNLGTFADIVFNHQNPGSITFEIEWRPNSLSIFSENDIKTIRSIPNTQLLDHFEATIENLDQIVIVKRFLYRIDSRWVGMEVSDNSKTYADLEYVFIIQDPHEVQDHHRLKLPSPIKFFGFPNEISTRFNDTRHLFSLMLSFNDIIENIFYLGPLREYPNRSYLWTGGTVRDVGRRGELTIQALLQAKKLGIDLDQRIAEQLFYLGLIYSFKLQPVSEGRQEYEVRIRQTENSPEVLLTEVGFGVSQILPVLTLCYFAPEGSTIILEQPEIHLHPAVQARLADIFINVIKNRHVQIILESHSEHLLRRLQLGMAEEKLSIEDIALYFTQMENGKSKLEELKIDEYGSISNWPPYFFGDEMGDLVTMMDATMRRQGITE